ncbi:diacylglycerol/lipid kinase family protein [Sinosporangium siamense]|uniref:Diacylglycerol kinase n=1 Tax=Sinosporangium siamense TaxID=1367973 RepID=A0A919RGT0_9ACTN|nr:diacylglycerol kinase family protein [Sinosporangium siamense]GII92510.1 diacylglycerol kinase [Sinosporangium siamense]
MRAMLLVNPKATTTHSRTTDVLIRALGAAVDLSVEETCYRGHAAVLASNAHAKGYDVVVVLGGDGTVNETVNGLLTPSDLDDHAPPAGSDTDGPGGRAPRTRSGGRSRPAVDGGAARRPALAVIPGGSANVFARALGLPNDPVEATGAILEALRDGRRRSVGLGQALWEDESRYFTFCSGLGYDAEVIRAVEGLRSAGYTARHTLYMGTALRHFLMTDRRHAAMSVEGPGISSTDGVFMAIITNTSPWTYVGQYPVTPTPWSSFDTGLDMLGLRRLKLSNILALVPQILGERDTLPIGRNLFQLHDEAEFTLTAERPTAFQLDGDYLGERERVTFRSIPQALQVLV